MQGTKDKLADLSLLKPVIAKLENKASLYILEDADHSLKLPKIQDKDENNVFKELSGKVKEWAKEIL